MYSLNSYQTSEVLDLIPSKKQMFDMGPACNVELFMEYGFMGNLLSQDGPRSFFQFQNRKDVQYIQRLKIIR